MENQQESISIFILSICMLKKYLISTSSGEPNSKITFFLFLPFFFKEYVQFLLLCFNCFRVSRPNIRLRKTRFLSPISTAGNLLMLHMIFFMFQATTTFQVVIVRQSHSHRVSTAPGQFRIEKVALVIKWDAKIAVLFLPKKQCVKKLSQWVCTAIY